jgi:glycosyltransferase involved in cell wall biosynthesis
VKLLIISNMSHYLKDGRVLGWGPTVQEINHLSKLFDEVRHIGFLHPEQAPASSLPYESENIHLVPVNPTGGKYLLDKFKILSRTPEYIRTIRNEMKKADVIHLRCPANITLLALLVLSISKNPAKRWIKYAGNWRPNKKEPWSYTLQRWMLRRGLHRGVATVNGTWEGDPEFIRPFTNPCLDKAELDSAKEIGERKRISDPIRLVYAGRLEEEKGVGRCLKILASLKEHNIPAHLDFVGDGPQRGHFETMARSLKVDELVHFHGWLPRTKLPEIYAKGHIFLFPSSSSEGWPKVISEAMAYGMVPVTSRISSIPQFLEMFECGAVLNPDDIEGFVNAINSFRTDPEKWQIHSQKGMNSASLFTYENYLKKVAELLNMNRDVSPKSKIDIPAVSNG